MMIDDVMALAPVIPVLVIDDVKQARAIAEALVAGGLRALEVTLRTQSALGVIEEMAKVPGAIVGAGTVLNAGQLHQAAQAGAQFIVSPGLTAGVAEAAVDRNLPYLPGIANAGDIMRGLDLGLDRFKFFPAEAAGGIKALKALAAPFYRCRFCPTGGISEVTAPDWLALDAVACVGGSWVVPSGPVDPGAIYERAKAAAGLGKG
jgi:2-dehydro-3-deoxyphosphogluconate aldolase/(4S)-4-hydroxy-2-oxoglutarate aldolase